MSNAVDVACFGEILWDFYEAVPKEKEAISRSFKREIGGATANVAVTLAKLGIKSSVVRSAESNIGTECRSRWSPYH